jgi:large subunit ribosomal protein L29
MKLKELRQRSKLELEKILRESREKLRQLRFDLSSGKVKNVREIRQLRREIAQVLTVLRQGSGRQS